MTGLVAACEIDIKELINVLTFEQSFSSFAMLVLLYISSIWLLFTLGTNIWKQTDIMSTL